MLSDLLQEIFLWKKSASVWSKLNKDTNTALFYKLKWSSYIADFILNIYYMSVILRILKYKKNIKVLGVCNVKSAQCHSGLECDITSITLSPNE